MNDDHHREPAAPASLPRARPCSRRQALTALGAWGAAIPLPSRAAHAAPPLMLARRYAGGVNLAGYGVSEKYDGVRGYWDGSRLLTRGGEAVMAPTWFTVGLPPTPLDGELWAGRGGFADAVSTVRRQTPDDTAWRRLRFMVFDLPGHGGRFAERASALARLVPALGKPWLQAVAQDSVGDEATLRQRLAQTVREGGEGLVLHRLDAPYRAGRSDDLLKLKPDDDADARVLAHVPGRGKYRGMMGALLVETPDGLRFKLGSGFDEAQRRDPPPVGSWISYRYRGETERGLPRFATFLRTRADLSR